MRGLCQKMEDVRHTGRAGPLLMQVGARGGWGCVPSVSLIQSGLRPITLGVVTVTKGPESRSSSGFPRFTRCSGYAWGCTIRGRQGLNVPAHCPCSLSWSSWSSWSPSWYRD